MVDWKTYKGEGPWPFVEQPNKWGYLNNPRWTPTPIAPINYDAGGEPQIWTPEGQHSAAGSGEHFPCGHWHKQTLTGPPTTAPPLLLIPWMSCPQTVLYGNNTDDIFFATTDHDDPISTLYIIRYNRVTNTWTVLYTKTTINDSEGTGWDFRWIEPEISAASRGSICVFGFARILDDGVLYPAGLDIFTFNGEALISNTFISPIVPGRGSIFPFYYSDWISIDSAGRIHILKVDYAAGISYYYDCVSIDNGVSFTPHFIFSAVSYTYFHHLTIDSSDNIWVWGLASKVYKSADHGSTWSLIGTTPLTASESFQWLNSALFIINQSGTTTKIYRSVDGIAWSEVLSFNKSLPRGGTLAYDGTFYYAIFNYRDGVVHPGAFSPTGTNYVYRSADGINWAQVSNFIDDSELGSSDSGSAHIAIYGSKLVYTYYYASTFLVDTTDVFMMTVWESSDQGITWVPIQTPFYDLTTGIAP